MNSKLQLIALPCLLAFLSCGHSQASSDGILSRSEDGTITIATDSLAQGINGFNGPIPIVIEIKDDKISDLTLGAYQDDPEFATEALEFVKKQVVGKTPKEALDLHIDAYSGATYSSEGIIKNLKKGLEYATK